MLCCVSMGRCDVVTKVTFLQLDARSSKWREEGKDAEEGKCAERRARATQYSRTFCVYTAVQVLRPEILLSETSRTNTDGMFVRSCSRGRKHFPVKQLITTIDRIAIFSLSVLSQSSAWRQTLSLPSTPPIFKQFSIPFTFLKQPIKIKVIVFKTKIKSTIGRAEESVHANTRTCWIT